MIEEREILTAKDVASELRCSTMHVYNVLNGKIKNVARLPSIWVGRRKLIRRSSLERWKRLHEHGDDGAMMVTPETQPVGRMETEERSHA